MLLLLLRSPMPSGARSSSSSSSRGSSSAGSGRSVGSTCRMAFTSIFVRVEICAKARDVLVDTSGCPLFQRSNSFASSA